VLEAHGEDELPPHGVVDAVQAVLVHHDRVGAQQPCAHARGRLVGDLGAHLQQPQRELWRGQRRDEEAHVGVLALLHLDHDVLHLVHQVEAQLAVLQQHPRAVDGGGVHGLDRYGFLALAKRHAVDRELLLLCKLLD